MQKKKINTKMYRAFLLTMLVALTSGAAQQNRKNSFRGNAPVPKPDTFEPYPADRHDGFDWVLAKTLASENPGSNMVISPVSVKILLSLLHEGASGTTETELENVLDIPGNELIARARVNNTISSLLAPSTEYELEMGTRLFIDKKFPVQQRYSAILKTHYSTDVESLDFTQTKASSDYVNNWVKNITHGHIPSLVTEDDMKYAAMMMMNAIYFKGRWTHEFPKNQTHDSTFIRNTNDLVPARFMTVTENFYHYESPELDATIIRLPYEGSKFAMYVFLPNSQTGVAQLIQDLNPPTFKRQLAQMTQVQAQVILPKMNFEFTARLANTLQQLGIRKIFDSTASLAGISRRGTEDLLVVSNVLQKSGVEINEEGTTAFAASTVQLGSKFGDPDYVFNASHPFVFIIEDETSGNIVFFGKVSDPTQTSGQTNEPALRPKPPKIPTINNVPGPTVNADEEQFLTNTENLNDQIVNEANYFDVALLQTICESQPGNVLVSPLSVKVALAIISEGATGTTASEIQTALFLPEYDDARRNYLQMLLSIVQRPLEGVILKMANKIYHTKDFAPLATYKQTIQTDYNTELQAIDFSQNQAAANIINRWVEESTSGLIKSVVTPDALDAGTVMMILNALYFKGTWLKAFSKSDTVPRCFYITEKDCEQVDMMRMEDTLRYASINALDAQAVDLPYKGKGYSMLFLVPNKKDGIGHLVRYLAHHSIQNIMRSLNETEIALSLPKFHLEQSQDLVNVLQNLGIRKLFTSSAELMGIAGPVKDIGVSTVHHKVSLEVNEEGSVAAAVTGAVIIPLMGSSIPHVRADHPFLLFLYEQQTGTVLFAGRISNPK